MLANGQGKSRLSANSIPKKKYTWKTIFLSTGEISIGDKVQEDGKRVKAGMTVRCIDVPADAEKGYKLFDTLYHFNDGEGFAAYLQEVTMQYHGTPIIEFLTRLTKKLNWKKELSDIKEVAKIGFFKEYLEHDTDGQIKRIANHFVDLAVAGEFAISLGILPWKPLDVAKGIEECFKDYLRCRGSNKAHEEVEIIAKVSAFIEAHHKSRIITLGEDDHDDNKDEKINNVAGYKKKLPDGEYEFYIFASAFQEMCDGFNRNTVIKVLTSKGYLIAGDKTIYKQKRLPLGKKHNVYHLKIHAQGSQVFGTI